MASERTKRNGMKSGRKRRREGGRKKQGESTSSSQLLRDREGCWYGKFLIPSDSSFFFSCGSFRPSFFTPELSSPFLIFGPSLNSSHFVSSSLCPFHPREPISTNSPGNLWKGEGKRWRRRERREDRREGERERIFGGACCYGDHPGLNAGRQGYTRPWFMIPLHRTYVTVYSENQTRPSLAREQEPRNTLFSSLCRPLTGYEVFQDCPLSSGRKQDDIHSQYNIGSRSKSTAKRFETNFFFLKFRMFALKQKHQTNFDN